MCESIVCMSSPGLSWVIFNFAMNTSVAKAAGAWCNSLILILELLQCHQLYNTTVLNLWLFSPGIPTNIGIGHHPLVHFVQFREEIVDMVIADSLMMVRWKQNRRIGPFLIIKKINKCQSKTWSLTNFFFKAVKQIKLNLFINLFIHLSVTALSWSRLGWYIFTHLFTPGATFFFLGGWDGTGEPEETHTDMKKTVTGAQDWTSDLAAMWDKYYLLHHKIKNNFHRTIFFPLYCFNR